MPKRQSFEPEIRACPTCGRSVPVVNYGIERGREVGYLGRHWRPGIRREAKCRGSFGPWVGRDKVAR